MKKIFIPLLILIPFFGFSQKVSLAPEIGLNIIPMESSEIGQNFHLGYHFGGHFKYHFSKKFKLSSGVFLTQKKKSYSSSSTGSVFTLFDDLLNGFGGLGGGLGLPSGGAEDLLGLDSLNIPGLNTDYTESINGVSSELFIEIPVLANYKVKNVNFYLGPYAALLIAANRKEELTTDIPLLDVIDLDLLLEESGLGGFGGAITSFIPQSGVESSETSGTIGLRTFDVGVNAGVGYEMNNLHFNFMYSHGLLDYRDDNSKVGNTETLKLFRISMAYFFNLGKQSSDNSSSFN